MSYKPFCVACGYEMRYNPAHYLFACRTDGCEWIYQGGIFFNTADDSQAVVA
jgi:hypothetical protein